MSTPKCFISYSWDGEEHQSWVRRLASKLQNSGVETFLDQWDVYPGINLAQYMETSIRDSDYVILVCTHNYAKKANLGLGGVGYEKSIVTGEIYGQHKTKKFIPILRGDPELSRPSYLKSRAYIDFRDEAKFEKSSEEILRHIFDSPKYTRPKLGDKPVFRKKDESNVNAIEGNSFKLFKEIYEFAFSKSGLDKPHEEAVKFTRNLIRKLPDEDFSTYKKAYDFASLDVGLRYSKEHSEIFANVWVSNYYGKNLDRFIELYNHAYSLTGLDKTKEESVKYALYFLDRP